MRCETCFYSTKTKVIDPITVAFGKTCDSSSKEILRNSGLLDYDEITKCYYAGKPQVVNGSEDWCYQWKEKVEVN